MSVKELVNGQEMARMMDRLVFQIIEACPELDKVCLVGIHRRGVILAKRMHELIKKYVSKDLPIGFLDITLYRDDLSEIARFPKVYATEVDFDIEGKVVVLVDDVLYTGRTVRAALEALSDMGRASRILMLALIDRGHRELPIKADFVGRSLPTGKKEIIHVNVKEVDGVDNVTIEKRA